MHKKNAQYIPFNKRQTERAGALYDAYNACAVVQCINAFQCLNCFSFKKEPKMYTLIISMHYSTLQCATV